MLISFDFNLSLYDVDGNGLRKNRVIFEKAQAFQLKKGTKKISKRERL